jgi:hypothetical protein
MAERLSVAAPDLYEQFRQTAVAIADLYIVLGTIVEHAKELVPGEAVDELTDTWEASRESIRLLVDHLSPEDTNQRGTLRRLVEQMESEPAVQPPADDRFADLIAGELTGKPGELKRSTLARLRDQFFACWNSEPRTRTKRRKAQRAGIDYLEFAGTFVGSILRHEKVVELISLTKQLMSIRLQRGY